MRTGVGIIKLHGIPKDDMVLAVRTLCEVCKVILPLQQVRRLSLCSQHDEHQIFNIMPGLHRQEFVLVLDPLHSLELVEAKLFRELDCRLM